MATATRAQQVLVAGGAFTVAGGVAADHAAQLDGALWTPMGPGVDNSVYAVDASSGVLYAGGAFESSRR